MFKEVVASLFVGVTNVSWMSRSLSVEPNNQWFPLMVIMLLVSSVTQLDGRTHKD